MNNKFKRMNKKDMYKTYGGFQISLVIAIPLILQAVVTTISSIKMLFSNKGSVSYNGLKSEWAGENQKQSQKTTTNENFFFF